MVRSHHGGATPPSVMVLYFLRPLQKTLQPFLSNIFISLTQHVSALALFTCDILKSKQAKIKVKMVRTGKL